VAETVALTLKQIAAQKEAARSGSPAAARMGGGHQPLNDNSTAVARAMRHWYPARAIVSAKSSAS